MTEDMKSLLAKSDESLAAARVLQGQGFFGYAASRAYYAMFYAAEAALLTEGKRMAKHSGVMAEFGKVFAAPGRVAKEFHRFLLEAFEVRTAGDYDDPGVVSRESAGEQITRAQQFIAAIRILIGGETPA